MTSNIFYELYIFSTQLKILDTYVGEKMSAPSKVQINQLVKIQPKESVADTLEVNFTFMEATK